MIKFSILITTKNRLKELEYTLNKIEKYLNRNDVECIICDDGSSDGTSDFIKSKYPKINVLRNEVSQGLIYSRNRLLNLTKAKYSISIDDDAHFLSDELFESIEKYFRENINCGLGAFRIIWSKTNQVFMSTKESSQIVKGFVGCGHVWNMEAWKSIPNYPAWFVFYGEEDFAAFELFKHGWEVHYLPQILVQHRVNLKSRKKQLDYYNRLRRSLRAAWYLYFMFYPLKTIPKRFLSSIWAQLNGKVFKGDIKALNSIFLACIDIIINFTKIYKGSNRLTEKEYQLYQQLPDTKLYWSPNKL